MSPLAREKCAVLPHYNVAFPCLTHKRKPASTACQSFMSWATAIARTCFHSALEMKIVTDWRRYFIEDWTPWMLPDMGAVVDAATTRVLSEGGAVQTWLDEPAVAKDASLALFIK